MDKLAISATVTDTACLAVLDTACSSRFCFGCGLLQFDGLWAIEYNDGKCDLLYLSAAMNFRNTVLFLFPVYPNGC
jgi:hypothetical protein